MGVAGTQIDEALLREAAQWFVRVHGEEASTEEFGAWQQWLTQDSAHRQAFKHVEDLWQAAGQAKEVPWPSARELNDDRYRPGMPVARWLGELPSRRVWLQPTVIAAGLTAVLLAAGALVLRPHLGSKVAEDSASITTRLAEDREVALSDGSQLTIGAQSRIEVDLSGQSRSIVVNSGEAFFKVARERRPFVVHAGEGTITALGTAFNVRHLEGRVVVTVTEGRVKVASPGGEAEGGSVNVELKAGEQVAYGLAPIPVRPVDPDVATSWRSGRLKYLDEPLKFVIRDVGRYTSRQIAIADPAVGEMRYTGTVLPNEVDDWLASVQDAFAIEVVREEREAVLLRERRR